MTERIEEHLGNISENLFLGLVDPSPEEGGIGVPRYLQLAQGILEQLKRIADAAEQFVAKVEGGKA